MEHQDFMQQALLLAEDAAREGEVPVGCVIVRRGEIVGRGRNRRETAKPLWDMQRLKPLPMPAKIWEAGGFGNAPCTSP